MSHHNHGQMDHMDHSKHMGAMNIGSVISDNGSTTDSSSTTDAPMNHMDMGMKMYFHLGCDEVILFDWWRISTVWELLLSMLGICVLGFLYESLKYGREYMFRRSIQSTQYISTSKNNITITDGQLPVRYLEQIIMPPAMHMMSSEHLVQTLLHMLQFLVSYFLMLIFMTYNTWLCLACLVGAGLGYFFFGWRKSVVVDITEHCH